MTSAPRRPAWDSTLAFLSEGYPFILNRCRASGTNAFETRLLLLPVVCLSGEEAARLFYDEARFQRRGAMPLPVQRTLLGQGSVLSLDGAAHRQRKGMLMSLMTPQATAELAESTFRQWYASSTKWELMDRVVLNAPRSSRR